MNLKKRTLVLVLVALAAACLLVLPSCSAFSPKDKVNDQMTELLDAVKDGSSSQLGALAECLDSEEVEGYGVSEKDLLNAYLEGFDYSIQDVTVNNGEAEVDVVFTVKKYSEFIDAFSETAYEIPLQDGSEDLSDEELYAQFGEAILETLSSTSTGQTEAITFNFSKSDGEWQPVDFENTLASALVSL